MSLQHRTRSAMVWVPVSSQPARTTNHGHDTASPYTLQQASTPYSQQQRLTTNNWAICKLELVTWKRLVGPSAVAATREERQGINKPGLDPRLNTPGGTIASRSFDKPNVMGGLFSGKVREGEPDGRLFSTRGMPAAANKQICKPRAIQATIPRSHCKTSSWSREHGPWQMRE